MSGGDDGSRKSRGSRERQPPIRARVGGLGGLFRCCVAVVATALVAAALPWPGAEAAARAGVAVLLSTPYVATLWAAGHYVRERQWLEAGLAVLLATLLLVGLWLGTGRG